MITSADILPIGELHKPHGVRGEIVASFDSPEIEPEMLRCLLVYVEGIAVPFFIEESRPHGAASWLLKFEGIDDQPSAMTLAKQEIYALRDDLPATLTDDADGMYLSDLVGYTLADAEGNAIGIIDDIDDSTANTLIIVRRPDGRKTLVPYSDELLAGFDTDTRTLTLNVPEGVLDINN